MTCFPNGNLLASLPNELFLKIVGYLDVSSYYSFHNTNKYFFNLLFDLTCYRAKEIRKKAKNHLVLALGGTTETDHHEGFRRFFYYSEYFELVRGTPLEYITLNVSILSNADIRRLISEYRGLFKYNLIDYFTINLAVRSVIVSYKFLNQFYRKENANFKIILHALKTLGYEADVNFSSIHEIRSLEHHEGGMEENLYLYNYQNKNPAFRYKYETLRKYP